MTRKASRATHFGVCIDNTGYPASIEVGKLYAVIPDSEAAKHGYIRVIDESGEDYGYAKERFFVLEVPEVLAKALNPRPNASAIRAKAPIRQIAASHRRRKSMLR